MMKKHNVGKDDDVEGREGRDQGRITHEGAYESEVTRT